MPLSLLNRSELASFAQRTRIPTLPAALASVPFGFVLVRVRVLKESGRYYGDVTAVYAGFINVICVWLIKITSPRNLRRKS